MIIDLSNKNALVCGSSDGIGKCIALQLAEAGAHITLLARNEIKLQQVLSELDTSKGQKHNYLVADFSNPADVKQVVDHAAATNVYHILVNNTGGPPGGPITQATDAAFYSAFQAHLINNHHLVQAVWEGMKNSGYGRIINVISTSVKIPLKGLGVSNTIRGAVGNWSKTLSLELAPFGITVNNVLPGATKTGRLSSIIENKADKAGHEITEVEAEMLSEIPMGRFGSPDEVAHAAVFLASKQAAYITGTNIVVDGGRTGNL
ncbi:MAG: SDR family oxidoreductase [Bacteroidetes bacterium]|nr:MAG: SDR family oxidoreductase [Bacteroidota bacterium]